MDIFGIGPLEFFLILLVALIVLGPNDMAKAGRSLGRFLRKLVKSEEWGIINRSAREFKYLPNRLMREAGMEDIKNELPDLAKDADLEGLNRDLREWQQDVSSWTKTPETQEIDKNENTILSPQASQAVKSGSTKTTQPVKEKFSWDDPDIVPVEDPKS